MASPFSLALCARAVSRSSAVPSSSRLVYTAKAFSSIRPSSSRFGGLPSAGPSRLQARHLSLGWPFKNASDEVEAIIPRAPSDIDVAQAAASVPPVDPNPLPATPPPTSSTLQSTPNLPQQPYSQAPPPVDSVSDLGSVVDPETGILENGVDLRYLPEHLGDLKAQGLGSWWPSGVIQQLLELIHVGTGLPWWATIVVLTLAIRMAIFPLVKSGLQSSARMAKFMPEMKQYQTAIEAAQDQPTKMQLSMALQKAMKREKISMLGPLKQPLISIPVFLGMFWGIESMCKLPVWQFKVQGIPDWCTDLTVADPLFILPITSGIATWCIIHYGAAGTPPSAAANHMGDLMQKMRSVLKVGTIVMIPWFGGFTLPEAVPLVGGMGPSGFPAAVLLYWTTSNTFTALQSFTLSRPAVRKYFDLPIIEADPTAPAAKPSGSFVDAFKKSVKWDENVAKARQGADAKESKLRLLQEKEARAIKERSLEQARLAGGAPVAARPVTPAPTAPAKEAEMDDLWAEEPERQDHLEKVKETFRKQKEQAQTTQTLQGRDTIPPAVVKKAVEPKKASLAPAGEKSIKEQIEEARKRLKDLQARQRK